VRAWRLNPDRAFWGTLTGWKNYPSTQPTLSGQEKEMAIIGAMDEPLSQGTVKNWHREEGWGSIQIEGVLEECFAHFSCIVQRENEFLELVPGEKVRLAWHKAQQDEFTIVADYVERS
jgi:cold shock CspA family protein